MRVILVSILKIMLYKMHHPIHGKCSINVCFGINKIKFYEYPTVRKQKPFELS